MLEKNLSTKSNSKNYQLLTDILLQLSILVVLIHIIMGVAKSLSDYTELGDVLYSLPMACLIFLIVTYRISRSRYYKVSPYLLFSFLYLLFLRIGYKWGVDLPISILLSVLLITMSGLIMTKKASLFSATAIIISAIIMHSLQDNRTLLSQSYWNINIFGPGNMLITAALMLMIAIICWSSKKQIESSLAMARESEKKLIEERKLLEMKIEERTEKLRQSQKEALVQFYRFAEYGKISSGLFHDLISPLMAVSFNIDRIKKSAENDEHLKTIKEDIDKAKNAVSRMEHLVTMTRKHFSNQITNECFSINKEIAEIVEILSYRIKRNNVRVIIDSEEERFMKGNPVTFGQIASNLILNAVEAYDEIHERKNNEIKISIEEKGKCMSISIKDNAKGIPEDVKEKIFTLFTTKGILTGTGVGLYLTRELVEKEFGGKISFDSSPKGTTFTVSLPKKKK